MIEITNNRANPLIDPELHLWHGEVAYYLFLGGLVAGIMALTGLMFLRRSEDARSRALSLAPWLSPILISLGMVFLWLDLANRLNALKFYYVFEPSSPMSWGAWILVLIYPASMLFAWTQTPEELRRRWRPRLGPLGGMASWAEARARNLAAWNLGLGASLGIYTGILLGAMAARPLWNSALLGPLFLASGLSTGAALLLLFSLKDRERAFLGRADMGLILVELLFLALWMIGLATAGAAGREALSLILGGPYTAAFWSLVVALGLVVPLAGEVIEIRHGSLPGRAAAILVLTGGLALRWILVFAGQHSGWVEHLAGH